MRFLRTTSWCGLLSLLCAALASARAPSAPARPSPTSQVSARLTRQAEVGLACVQDALGGTRSLAGVTSLSINSETKPAATTGMRPVAGTRQIVVLFPDRYKRVDVGRPLAPGASPMRSTVGFDRQAILSTPRLPDDEVTRRFAKADFLRQMLMRLPRETEGLRFSARLATDAGPQLLALEVSGPDGFRATLFADARTCLPSTVSYVEEPLTIRTELSNFRLFGGVRFATVLKTLTNGQPFQEEYVSDIGVNTPQARDGFPQSR
jgi:hypothetical protein